MWTIKIHRTDLDIPLEVAPEAAAIAAGEVQPPQFPVPDRYAGLNTLWAKLHLRALHNSGQSDADWLEGFAIWIPCGECRRHWAGWLASNPPRWGDYFAWTVEAHNAVNMRLQKPCLTVSDALQLWSPLTPPEGPDS